MVVSRRNLYSLGIACAGRFMVGRVSPELEGCTPYVGEGEKAAAVEAGKAGRM